MRRPPLAGNGTRPGYGAATRASSAGAPSFGFECVTDLDVVGQPRHLQHLPGHAPGRSEECELGAVSIGLVAKLLDQAKSLAVQILDLGEVHDHPRVAPDLA